MDYMLLYHEIYSSPTPGARPWVLLQRHRTLASVAGRDVKVYWGMAKYPWPVRLAGLGKGTE